MLFEKKEYKERLKKVKELMQKQVCKEDEKKMVGKPT